MGTLRRQEVQRMAEVAVELVEAREDSAFYGVVTPEASSMGLEFDPRSIRSGRKYNRTGARGTMRALADTAYQGLDGYGELPYHLVEPTPITSAITD